MADIDQDAQEIITCLSKSAETFWLKIEHKKTEAMYQPFPGSHNIGQNIQIESQVLTQVNKFKYLDSTFTNNNRLEAELKTLRQMLPRLLTG